MTEESMPLAELLAKSGGKDFLRSVVQETVRKVGGQAAPAKRTSCPALSDCIVSFEGAVRDAVRTLNIMCDPCGDQRIC